MAILLPDTDLSRLTVDERLRLIEELWDSLGAEDDVPLAEWHRQEIDTRLDALENGSSVGAPWSEVRRRIADAP